MRLYSWLVWALEESFCLYRYRSVSEGTVILHCQHFLSSSVVLLTPEAQLPMLQHSHPSSCQSREMQEAKRRYPFLPRPTLKPVFTQSELYWLIDQMIHFKSLLLLCFKEQTKSHNIPNISCTVLNLCLLNFISSVIHVINNPDFLSNIPLMSGYSLLLLYSQFNFSYLFSLLCYSFFFSFQHLFLPELWACVSQVTTSLTVVSPFLL